MFTVPALIAAALQCVPAAVAVVAWEEGAQRLLRQFGARMVWELSLLVAVALAFLLYETTQITADDGANIAGVSAGAILAVLAVTAAAQRTQELATARRAGIAAVLAIVTLPAGAVAGSWIYALLVPAQA